MDDTIELDIEDYKQLKTTDIAKSTVRKYVQVLERQGYQLTDTNCATIERKGFSN